MDEEGRGIKGMEVEGGESCDGRFFFCHSCARNFLSQEGGEREKKRKEQMDMGGTFTENAAKENFFPSYAPQERKGERGREGVKEGDKMRGGERERGREGESERGRQDERRGKREREGGRE